MSNVVNLFTISIARTGGDIIQLKVAEGTTIENALETAGLKVNRGEIVSREGSALDMTDKVVDGDILFIEANDENGIL